MVEHYAKNPRKGGKSHHHQNPFTNFCTAAAPSISTRCRLNYAVYNAPSCEEEMVWLAKQVSRTKSFIHGGIISDIFSLSLSLFFFLIASGVHKFQYITTSVVQWYGTWTDVCAAGHGLVFSRGG